MEKVIIHMFCNKAFFSLAVVTLNLYGEVSEISIKHNGAAEKVFHQILNIYQIGKVPLGLRH